MSTDTRSLIMQPMVAILVSFGVFFFSLNMYILTTLLDHPLRSPLWIIGVVVGLVALVFSIRMMRRNQAELIRMRHEVAQRSSQTDSI